MLQVMLDARSKEARALGERTLESNFNILARCLFSLNGWDKDEESKGANTL